MNEEKLKELQGLFSSNHIHTDMGSNLRMLDCTSQVNTVLERANELGYYGIAITEHESLTSHIQFMKQLKDLRDKGKIREDFKIAYGNEIYLVDEIPATSKYWHFIVVAKDKQGHEILRRLSSQAWQQSYFTGKMRRCPITYQQVNEIMEEYNGYGHVQVSTACLGSYLANCVKEFLSTGDIAEKKKIHKFIKWCTRTFGEENVYLEMQPNDDEEQVNYNKFLMTLSKAYNLPIHITNDVHYIKKEHKELHKAFLQSRDGDRETDDFYKTCYFMEMYELYDYLKDYVTDDEFTQIILNSKKFIDGCEQYDLFHPTIVPKRNDVADDIKSSHLLEEYYDEYEYIKKYAYSPYAQDRFMLNEICLGLVTKEIPYKEQPNLYLKRINDELTELWLISERLGERMSSYYNIVQYLIDVIWRVCIVGCGRGSVGSWYCAYLMSIHQVDSIKYGLDMYWRHIERNKISLPDVDTDCPSDKKDEVLKALKMALGYDNVLNVLILKTETTKSAVNTTMRGLGLNDDDAKYYSSLIEQERGKLFSLHDTWYGNEEKGRKPNTQFINEITTLSEKLGTDVKELLFTIEGLVSGYGSHACAVNIYNEGYIKQNSMMLAPNGLPITCWTYHDSEEVGDLKVDMLSTDALSKIQLTMNNLLKQGIIEWQGSLRDTYNKYLHPDNIDLVDSKLFDAINNGKVLSLFQFGDSEVGRNAIAKVQPHNVYELTDANSAMRLMGEDIPPIDKYVTYKFNPQLAYDKMHEYNLTNNEIKVIERLTKSSHFMCLTQENMMISVLDDEVSGFTRAESDKTRKVVAKKEMNKVEQLKEDFFSKGKSIGTSDNLLNYVWHEMIKGQLGYSFSQIHSLAYSLVALQEAYLYVNYNPLFWITSVLTNNSGSTIDVDYEDFEDTDYVESEEEVSEDNEEDNEIKKQQTVYDKMARALGDVKSHGYIVSPPYINEAEYDFYPNIEKNYIVFSLKAIVGLSDITAYKIVEERKKQSFTSLDDFIERVEPQNKELYALVKAGALDEFNNNRVALMMDIVKRIVGLKTTKLNGQNLPFIIANNLCPSEYQELIETKQLLTILTNKKNTVKIGKSVFCKIPLEYEDKISQFLVDMEEDKDYSYQEVLVVRKAILEKVINKYIEPFTNWLTSDEALEVFNRVRLNAEWKKNCLGDLAHWSFEALCYYPNEHELDKVDLDKYYVVNYNDLDVVPNQIGETKRGKNTYPIYEVQRIAGTVISKNATKHIVTLATPSGIVDVKFNKGKFSYYNKQISELQSNGKKKVLEKSWFKRGQMLMVVGFRRDNMFYPRIYKGSLYSHTVQKIEKVTKDGLLILQDERVEKENK